MRSLSGVVALATVLLISGCRVTGGQNESCNYSGDCGGGFVCFGGKCSTGTAGYSPTGKVCIALDCRVNGDCSGSETCTAGRCVCTADADCGFGRKCVSGACLSCTADADCNPGGGTSRVCVTGLCQNACVDSFECPDFYACGSDGKCAFSGCTTDKQCAISAGDVRVKCDTTKKSCYLGCSSDTDCGGSLTGGAWFGQVCSKNRCENVGCDTAADCQLFFKNQKPAECVAPATNP